MAATSAFAQVTISGNVDASFGTKEAINGAGKTIAKSTGVQDGLNAPNRIFINVTEDLGGGMKFKFQNEHGISLTNAQDWSVRQSNGAPTSQTLVDKTMTTSDVSIPGNAFLTNGTNRGTFVALEGGFGEVRAGYLVSQFYNLVAQSGYFLGSENYGALVQGHGIAAQGSTRGNGIDYKLPKVGAFTFSVQKRYGEERTITADSADAPYTSNKAETMSYRADYANGPLTAGYVYATHKGVVAAQAKPIGTSVFGVASTTNLVPNDVNNTADNKASALNAAYVMGNWKVAYQMTSATVNNTLDTDRKFKSSQIGIQYTMGNTSVFGISGNADTKKNDGTKTNDIKNTQFGVRHALSKRTTAYVMTGKSEDSAIAANDTTRAKEGKMTGVGLSHAF